MLRKRARSPQAKAHRREALLQAARAYLLAGGPVDGLRMAYVAQQAGLSKGSVYLYFSSKEALFTALFEAALEEWMAALAHAPLPPPPAPASVLVEALLAASYQAPLAGVLLRVFLPTLDPGTHPDTFARTQAALVEHLARGNRWLAQALGVPPAETAGLWRQLLLPLIGMAQLTGIGLGTRAALLDTTRPFPSNAALPDALLNLLVGWQARRRPADGHARKGRETAGRKEAA